VIQASRLLRHAAVGSAAAVRRRLGWMRGADLPRAPVPAAAIAGRFLVQVHGGPLHVTWSSASPPPQRAAVADRHIGGMSPLSLAAQHAGPMSAASSASQPHERCKQCLSGRLRTPHGRSCLASRPPTPRSGGEVRLPRPGRCSRCGGELVAGTCEAAA